MQADKLFVNGNIYTMKSENDTVEALATLDDKIIFTGTDKEASQIEAKEVVDLKGQTVIPGFTDTHIHLFAYCQWLEAVDLAGCKSLDEAMDRLRERASETPAGEWVNGASMDQTQWPENRLPDRWDLDKVSKDHPIFISRYCMHAFGANSLALQKAGIVKGFKPDVEGTIEFDENGEPTGILYEQAAQLIVDVKPKPLEKWEDKKKAVAAVLQDASSKGVTCMHTYGIRIWNYDEFIGVYQELDNEGKLPVRMVVCFDEMPTFGIKSGFGNNKVKYGTFKTFSDGSLGSHSCLLAEPYCDAPETCGISNYTQDELNQRLKTAYDSGLQISIHAIGDKGMDMALTAIENAYFANPRPNARFRVIHAMVLNEDLIRRMTKLPLVLDVQPKFVSSDLRWAEDRLGKEDRERSRLAFAWKTLLDNGLILSCGSDCPVEYYNPFLGVFAAVNRQEVGESHYPEGGWHPEQKVSVFQALTMYTKNGAYDSMDETVRGTLEVGKLADFVVLDRNPFTIDPFDLQYIQVLKTFLGSKEVFSR